MSDSLHENPPPKKPHGGPARLREMRHALAAEEQARQSAEREVKVKDDVLAQLAHELRTPLAPAMLAAAALEHDPRLPAELKPTVEMIRRNTALCAHLLDELMDAVSLTHDEGTMARGPVDLHRVVAQAIEVCADDADAKGVLLTCDPQARHALVHGNGMKLEQALWNLLKNAVKFTPAGGRVIVRTFNRPGAQGERVVVEVADTGIGIDAALLPKLVEAFQQGGAHIRRDHGGLGLGLTICHLVAKAHGGILTARSSGANQGSVLSLDLAVLADPAALAPADAAAVLPKATRALRSILIVEDHEDTRNALHRLLALEGFEVDCAGTVADASAAALARRYDVLLCDLELPDGTGHDLLRHLVGNRPAKVIALSGHAQDSGHGSPATAGFDLHLRKPVDLVALIDALS